jgi:hypothetical protein
MVQLPDGFTYSSQTPTQQSTAVEEEQTSSVLPEGFGPSEGEYQKQTSVAVVTEEEVEPVSSEELIAQEREERPVETASVRSLEEDDEFVADILQYREDRFGIAQDVGAANILIGGIVGPTQELTNENIVDDYLDHYRFIVNNSADAALEIGWLRGLQQKEEAARESGDNEAANNFAEQRARALRIYQRADSLGGLFDDRRYEGMTASEMVADIAETAGANTMAVLSDPLTLLTAGVGRVVAGSAAAAGQPLRAAIMAAATAAPLEGGAAAVTDLAVQTAEIEMGARDEIDLERTATVATISAATAGLLSGVGARNSAKRVDTVSRGELSTALARVQEEQTAAASAKNAELGTTSNDIRERLAKGITDVYGEDAIVRNKDGVITGLNSKVIRESEYAGRVKSETGLDLDDFEPALNFSTFERVTAATGEIIESVRKGSVKLTDVSGKELKDLSSKLQKDEMVSERLLNILTNASEESLDFTTEILGRYGITQRELAATLFADASWAGKRLRALRSLSDVVGRASRTRTVGEAAEEAEELAAQKLGETFRRLEDIRRLTLVSGVATAVRNNISQVIRSGVELPIVALETAINPNKKFGVRNSFAQLQHTFYDQKDAATITQFMLDLHTKQKQRFYNQFSEAKNTLNKKNPGQAAISKHGKKLGSESPILDRWEGVVTSLNYLNRFQEAMYRNGAFAASLQRQMFDKGLDMLDVMKSGKITENISEDMVSKAVDDALEFTYASQPKLAFFRTLNNMIVQSGATLAIPFPRFMFKAMEMTFNYNITGVGTALTRMALSAARGQKVTDGMYRQLAEGVAGGTPLLALGYMLRDPDGPHAGSEWYNLNDGRGNEFDARPFFPLTPYLLFGEMMHRYQEERPGGVLRAKEFVEGITGANFRGSGAAGKMLEDIVSWGLSGEDEVGFAYSMRDMGRYLGEALSGYGQPLYQLADMFADGDQRMRDYKDDVNYQNGVSNFLGGLAEPFESRLKRVGEAVGFDVDDPWKEDPRFEQVPERVMPFFKILFGATLTRVPPKYVVELNRMGFSYVDFMSKTNSASVDRQVNRLMGMAMQEEMDEVLATAREDYGDDTAKIAAEVKNYISTMKSMIYADVKQSGEDTAHHANMQRFRRLGPYARRAAIRTFVERNGRNPVYDNTEEGQSDVLELLDLGKNNFKRYSKQRKGAK